MSDCLSDDQLQQLIAGHPEVMVAESWIAHVDDCGACQSRIAGFSFDHAHFDSTSSLPTELSSLTFDPIEPMTQLGDELLHAIDSRLAKEGSTACDPTSDTNTRIVRDAKPPYRIGPYVITRPIAVGGMGTVYEARHVNLGRTVAIKLLRDGKIHSRRQADQVLREWRAHGRLSHPDIVIATDAGLVDGRPYLVTELIQGLNLANLLQKTGALSLTNATEIIRRVADALNYAHSEGVAHLDIKPSNIMLDRSGRVKLLDLGTARISDLTHHGSGPQPCGFEADDFGTLGFLAPERTSAASPPKMSDPKDGQAADMYSLGCTLHCLLSGKPPFGSPNRDSLGCPSDADIIDAHRTLPPPKIRFSATETATIELQNSVQALLDRMLAKSPDERPQGMHVLASELATMSAGADLGTLIFDATPVQILTPPASTGETVQLTDLVPTSSGQKWIVLRIAAIVMIVSGMIFTWSLISGSPKQATDTADFGAKGKSVLDSLQLNEIDNRPLAQQYPSGFLFRSEKLLHRMRQQDPSVKFVTVKSTAPRHMPDRICWSPAGDRLALLSGTGQLRLYGWQDKQLTLQTICRTEISDEWINTFCWHPVEEKLIIASENALSIARITSDGNYQVERQEARFDDIRSVHTLRAGDRCLIVVVTSQRIFGWDPIAKQTIEGLCNLGWRYFASTGDQTRYAIQTDKGIEIWEAAHHHADTPGLNSHSQWKFKKISEVEVEQCNQVARIAFMGDQSELVVYRNGWLCVRTVPELEQIQRIRLPSGTDRDMQFEFLRSTDPKSIEWITSSGGRIRVHRAPASKRDATNVTQMTEIQGGQLAGARIAVHPDQNQIAVVYPGGLEVWNNDLQTIFRVPSLKPIVDIVPLQLQEGVAMITRDGGGVVLDTMGRKLGSAFPPVDPRSQGYEALPHHAILPSTLQLVQSSTRVSRPPSMRSLTDFGIPTQIVNDFAFSVVPYQVIQETPVPNVTLPGVGGSNWQYLARYWPESERAHGDEAFDFQPISTIQPKRTALAQRAGRLVIIDSNGRYTVRGISDRNNRIIQQGTVDNVARSVAITVDPDARTLFVTSNGNSKVRVDAIDLHSGVQQWQMEFEELSDGSNPVWLDDQRLLVTNQLSWFVLNPQTGEMIEDVSPRYRYGFRHNASRRNPFDNLIHSWDYKPWVEPMATWSADLNLRWIAFATDTGGWIVLSPDGDIVESVRPDAFQMNRFVGTMPTGDRPATWAPDAVVIEETDPRKALSIARHHDDGRITIAAFE